MSLKMNIIYNTAISAVNAALKTYARFLPKTPRYKFQEFVKGRVGLIRRVYQEMANDDKSLPVVWFHASSLGEYAIARPLIARLKAKRKVRIVMTFFSPSGYRVVSKNHQDIDHVFYLPLDTILNTSNFVKAVNPAAAVFLVSEYWPNMLQTLKFKAIPTFLVSAKIRSDAPFFKWYGKIYRDALSTYKHFFVLDEDSRFNLKMLGWDNMTVSGDPLFDNASLMARTEWSDPVIERFIADDRPVFMAGSVSEKNDIALVAETVNRHPQIRSIIVPHDIGRRQIEAIQQSLERKAVLYSQVTENTDFSQIDTLIIDSVGKLAYIYRYATMAYVGGGFTPLLHSVIEATVYGVPVSFGPCIERKITPQQMIELGIGQMVRTPEELSSWVDKFTPGLLAEIKEKCAEYVERNLGATPKIVNMIEHYVWPTE